MTESGEGRACPAFSFVPESRLGHVLGAVNAKGKKREMVRNPTRMALFSKPSWRQRAWISVVLALMCSASTASAQNEHPHWYALDYGKQARLVYGTPGGPLELIFVCDKGSPALSALLAHPATRAATGTALTVSLSNERMLVEFPATVKQMDRPRLAGQVMLDPPLEMILSSSGQLKVSASGTNRSYPLDGAATAARQITALCGSVVRAALAADLSVTASNKSRRQVVAIGLREPDSIETVFDAFGYDGLMPGHQRAFTIPGGAGICTYEISVDFEVTEEDCCSDPIPVGQQNLCDDPRIVVRD